MLPSNVVTHRFFPEIEKVITEGGIENMYKPIFVDILSRNFCMSHMVKSMAERDADDARQ